VGAIAAMFVGFSWGGWSLGSITVYKKIVLNYRGVTKPNLAELGRLIGRASGLLKIADLDEKFEIENKATLLLAKDLGLVS
jgi:hypothetical protein